MLLQIFKVNNSFYAIQSLSRMHKTIYHGIYNEFINPMSLMSL